ncbi:MAG: transporter substrate-binding domain-containing protein [Colwelliaceae bacterium]|jgi:polar amino acid transport system substrate-binding protein|nr:transporter substrate-binding domain-containing protein [Colwelliaceae bacterium]
MSRKICLLLLIISLTVSSQEKQSLKIVAPNEAQHFKPLITLINSAYKNLNVDVSFAFFPAKRAFIEAQKNTWVDAELVRIAMASQLLPQYVRIPVEILNVELILYSKVNIRQLSNWQSLTDYRIATMRGLIYVTEQLEKNNIDDVTLVTSAEQAFKLLHAGRVDLVLMPNLITENILQRHQEYQFEEVVIDKVPVYHYLHKRHKALVEPLTQELIRLIKETKP